MAAFYRGGYRGSLMPQWLPALDSVAERLEAGIDGRWIDSRCFSASSPCGNLGSRLDTDATLEVRCAFSRP